MTTKKVVVGDYTDHATGIRFIEDDRGNYHIVSSQGSTEHGEIKVVVDTINPFRNENEMLRRVMEKLRSENSWLYEVIERSRKIWKDTKNPKKAMEYLEKAIKERERL